MLYICAGNSAKTTTKYKFIMVDCKRVFIVTQHHNFNRLILGVYDSIDKARDRESKERNYHSGVIGYEFHIDIYEVL